MRKMVAGVLLAGVLMAGATGVASADQDNGEGDAFLCPVVGAGTLGAAGLDAFLTPAGPSFLPGDNQAGVHANINGLNENGGPVAGNEPGADGFTPIWNP